MKTRAVASSTVGDARNDSVIVFSHSIAVAEAIVGSLPYASVIARSIDEVVRLDPRTAEPAVAILVAFDFATAAAGIRQLKRRWRGVRVLVVGLDNDEDSILRTLASGALGIVMRQESLEELRAAVHDVMSDRFHAPPQLIRPLFDRLVAADNRPRPGEIRWPLARLSAREVGILARLGRGESNKDIAAQLHVEVQTVKNHVSHILRKLGVHNRYDAVRVGGPSVAGNEIPCENTIAVERRIRR